MLLDPDLSLRMTTEARMRLVDRHLDSLLESDGRGGFTPTRYSLINLYELLLRMVNSWNDLSIAHPLYQRILTKGKFSDIQRCDYLGLSSGQVTIEQRQVIRQELIDSNLPLNPLTFYERLDSVK